MSNFIATGRAPRSTRTFLAIVEAEQSQVIATLIETGHDDIAQRLARCQHDRQHRQPGAWPWRCRSGGCWQCRRTTIRQWWCGFRSWLTGNNISLALIPLTGDTISATKKLRRGLRGVRDRRARRDHRWRTVAFAGLADGDRALVLVEHPCISRDEVWEMLEQRWPEIALTDVEKVEPVAHMTVADAAALARRRRGIERLRIFIPAQMVGTVEPECWDDQAMPMVF